MQRQSARRILAGLIAAFAAGVAYGLREPGAHPLASLTGEERWVLLVHDGLNQPPADVVADLLPHLEVVRHLADGRGVQVATLSRVAPDSPYGP